MECSRKGVLSCRSNQEEAKIMSHRPLKTKGQRSEPPREAKTLSHLMPVTLARHACAGHGGGIGRSLGRSCNAAALPPGDGGAERVP